jgi:hypothetical protein
LVLGFPVNAMPHVCPSRFFLYDMMMRQRIFYVAF